MKMLRVFVALGVAAWFKRKAAAKAIEKARSGGRAAGLHAPRVRRTGPSVGTHQSAASAASGAWRDDRDVAGIGVLRDEEATRP